MANVVATGALLALLPILTLEDIEAALKAHMPGRHKHLLPKNVEALKRGAEYAREHVHKAK
jgi:Pyruvate/2-oxoacid:ferredoxin oxidoreductase gamma subunit